MISAPRLLFLAFWLWPNAAAASEATTLYSSGVVPYLIVLFLGLVGIGVGWIFRKRAGISYVPDDLEALRAPPPAGVYRTTQVATSRPSFPTPLKTPAFRVSNETSSLHVLFAQDPRARECPKCKTRYTETTLVCPDDATPLVPLNPGQRSRAERTEIEKGKTCGNCGRVFEAGAKFCHHDGSKLGRSMLTSYAIFRVCRTCGYQTEKDQKRCPHDDGLLIEVRPDAPVVPPPIPILECTSCGNLHSSAEDHCKTDGSALIPVLDLAVRQLPASGFGPRRRICPECKTLHSGYSRKCPHDATTLVDIN